MATIGIFAAKARLSELVRKAEAGERFTITSRGQAKASLVPFEPEHPAPDVAKAVEDLLNFPRIKGIDGDTVLEWIREGRK